MVYKDKLLNLATWRRRPISASKLKRVCMAQGKQRSSDAEAPLKSKEIIKKYYKRPIVFYRYKDLLARMATHFHFADSMLSLATFIALVYAFPYYPIVTLPIIAIIIVAATLYRPFLGLIVLAAFTFPMLVYQAPILGWMFLFVISGMLIYGYMHYRTIMFLYLLSSLSFSYLGYIFAIPFFVLAILMVGYKRAAIMTVLFVLAAISGSALLGINNYSYIVYNGIAAHASFMPNSVLNYTVVTKNAIKFGDFWSTTGKGFGTIVKGSVVDLVSEGIVLSVAAIFQQYYYLLSLATLLVACFAIDFFATNLKSKYRGTESSIIALLYPIGYIAIYYLSYGKFSNYATALISFLIAPAMLYVLESYNVRVVKTLDIRKQDLRMKFGEAFEDLEAGNVSETFNDIGNYEETKEELKNAVLSPIEQKAISRAYNIAPAKGLLFFGPPGTGKTMMMRALANEIRAGFYYVKASNLISSYPGETERKLAEIFGIARKHAPCVLFFDEIDAIGSSRDSPELDETHRQALSQLLVEMDGFQKINNVIIVGATNVPQVLDKALLRPGRFDKIIYLPLPDFNGRKKIFEIYLSKLPVAQDVDLDVLAEKTERYSGADIKALCESISQVVAQKAVSKHAILEITMKDFLNAIDATKPSTSLAQIDEYNRFKLDFERQIHGEASFEKEDKVYMKDVVGLEDAKKALNEAIAIPLLHPDLVKKYDVPIINGILLFGPPGTGKTMLMHAVASEYKGLALIAINGAEIAREGIEKASATIKDVFNRAKDNAPAIIFMDEIDGLITRRENASEFSAQITTEILTEMDGLKKYGNVVVVAATNRPDALDPAILRPGRFDKLIFIRPPNAGDRAEMFKNYLSNVPLDSNIDYQLLSSETQGFTGADIYNVCREAKTKALEERISTGKDVSISTQSLEEIIKMIRPSAPEIVVSAYLSFLSKYGQR
ncbi:MAG: AAA family ATPase [Candidatus Micrarchaeia archaeon]